MGGKTLGIDIGSVSSSCVVADEGGRIVQSSYMFHQGNVRESLIRQLGEMDLSDVRGVGCTSSTPAILRMAVAYNSQLSLIEGVKKIHGRVGSILVVGGERFCVIHFDTLGQYRRLKSNSSCAAGTGGFLDQQARRLNLNGSAELSEIAFRNKADIPKIASRCAVFAKTDLIHAQQEGYSIEEICDGLCHGLAKSIVDTLFTGDAFERPMVFAGGVSKNRAVRRHLEALLGTGLLVDEYTCHYGALGAALHLMEEGDARLFQSISSPADLLMEDVEKKSYYYAPLEVRLSHYPEFSGDESYLFIPKHSDFNCSVEVDVYADDLDGDARDVYLGLDVGSTSTKAVLLDADDAVLAGFYTRTSGRPLNAMQGVFEAIDDMARKRNLKLDIRGCASTGSGRKFVGAIAGADLVIDEITAHARAAVNLDPKVDTIIEIGGQDSKFTSLREGVVVFSIMNTVCAAGTGSFIEEQAEKLGCPLSSYAAYTDGVASPIASDRCTVFMERDINHYLNRGYSVRECLAAVLHSIRDNYLSKVAVGAHIGDHICFQGATAKNRMLVAAFEQKLGKAIHVSKFCHLTGALGAALLLRDESPSGTRFRGIGLYEKAIPVMSEVCGLCANHCKIKRASVDGVTEAFGFLCGRDYATRRFIDGNNSGFDLLKERKRAFAFDGAPHEITIGIPAALHLFEELPLWRRFFDLLGLGTVSSENFTDAVKTGKMLAGAEFCAPIAALHGHVEYLKDRADYIFIPVTIEGRNAQKGLKRQFCYYTQFAPALAAGLLKRGFENRCIIPAINQSSTSFAVCAQLYRALRPVKKGLSLVDVYSAYEKAVEFHRSGLLRMKEICQMQLRTARDISVVLLGRPYTIFDTSMNKGIPDIFASMGIKTFYQDMISYEKKEIEGIEGLLTAFHWNYAARILETAEAISHREAIYPVLLTSFKCSPDSFVVEYFKRILNRRGKPYLILQLDEHDSNVGYETRIEAAVRAFRNHHRGKKRSPVGRHLPINPTVDTRIEGKTILFPNWDSLTCPLVTATLVREGYDARLLVEDSTTIQKSLRHNTGQCIPLNTIAQELIDYIINHDLNPERTALWLPGSAIACNIRLYPYYIKSILEAHGKGLEKTGVYIGDTTFIDMHPRMALHVYFAYMFGGMLKKLGCRVRPYERTRGQTDRAIESSLDILREAIINRGDRELAADRVVSLFEEIKTHDEHKPKVAIFGDLYVRDNDVMNQNLIRAVEDAGGEVITTPYSDLVRMVASPYFKRWLIEGRYMEVFTSKSLLSIVNFLNKKYYRYFQRVLKFPYPEYNDLPDEILSSFNVKIQHSGESLENLIKIFSLIKHHPDLSLFVQASPAFCCPSLVTEAMVREIERSTGIPIVSITYDGTQSLKNDVIIPYIKFRWTSPAANDTKEASCSR